MDFVAIQDAFSQVFLDWRILATIVAAAFYGIFMGAVPGLTATMAVALLIPLTYTQPTLFAFAAVVTLVACAIFSGDIPTTLVRMPGTPSSNPTKSCENKMRSLGREGVPAYTS